MFVQAGKRLSHSPAKVLVFSGCHAEREPVLQGHLNKVVISSAVMWLSPGMLCPEFCHSCLVRERCRETGESPAESY